MQRTARVKKELAMFVSAPPAGVSCSADGDDVTKLRATLTGPEGSPFERGTFNLDVIVPERYPFEPPQITFSTPVYHPNVDPSGRICLDALQMPPTGGWRPSLRLATLLMSVRLLMAEPNPDDPLMPDIAQEYRYRRAQYEETARQHTARHAIPKTVLSPIENRSGSSLDMTGKPGPGPSVDKPAASLASAGAKRSLSPGRADDSLAAPLAAEVKRARPDGAGSDQ